MPTYTIRYRANDERALAALLPGRVGWVPVSPPMAGTAAGLRRLLGAAASAR